jgi:hypothetical protein
MQCAQREHRRNQLAKGVLFASLLALVATSAPPRWSVDARQEHELPFQAGAPSRLTSEISVLYRTPKGRWPLLIYVQPSLLAAGTVDSGRVTLRAMVHDEFARGPEAPGSQEYTVVCDQKLCEGMITLHVTVEGTSETIRPYSTYLPDGGIMESTRRVVRASASFSGGIEDDFAMTSCESDGSTDREDAPKTLGLEMTFPPFEFDPSAPPLPAPVDAGVSPGAPPPDAGSQPGGDVRGMDAGLPP